LLNRHFPGRTMRVRNRSEAADRNTDDRAVGTRWPNPADPTDAPPPKNWRQQSRATTGQRRAENRSCWHKARPLVGPLHRVPEACIARIDSGVLQPQPSSSRWPESPPVAPRPTASAEIRSKAAGQQNPRPTATTPSAGQRPLRSGRKVVVCERTGIVLLRLRTARAEWADVPGRGPRPLRPLPNTIGWRPPP